MALWKDANPGTSPAPTSPGIAPAPARARESERTNVAPLAPLTPEAPRRAAPATAPRAEPKESHISADLTIEGKIVGSGHVRIAGRFKGDVQVDGNVTVEAGARIEGQVKAGVVIVAGELIGNVEDARRVELVETGVINGNVRAGLLTVAAGSRMRGQVEFGYEGEARSKTETKGFGNA